MAHVTQADAWARVDGYCRAHNGDYLAQAVLNAGADLMDEHAERLRQKRLRQEKN